MLAIAILFGVHTPGETMFAPVKGNAVCNARLPEVAPAYKAARIVMPLGSVVVGIGCPSYAASAGSM